MIGLNVSQWHELDDDSPVTQKTGRKSVHQQSGSHRMPWQWAAYYQGEEKVVAHYGVHGSLGFCYLSRKLEYKTSEDTFQPCFTWWPTDWLSVSYCDVTHHWPPHLLSVALGCWWGIIYIEWCHKSQSWNYMGVYPRMCWEHCSLQPLNLLMDAYDRVHVSVAYAPNCWTSWIMTQSHFPLGTNGQRAQS